MSATSPCPDRDVLRRLLAGISPEREQELIEAHLEECEACQADLDALAGGDESWPGRVKDLGQDPVASAPGLKRIIGVLKDDLEPDPETTGLVPGAPGEILGFLDPPDSTGDLGKLASYRVLEVLGEGGMGIVLKAVDAVLHRTVAIKVLAPQLASSSSARHRFAREARAAAAIRDEHVVAIHSVDEWKGLPYLVMEFIPGASLQQRIDRAAPLDLNSILRIGMQAASGLAAAHAQGLVHRDIKPSNILLENCVERVKITDFGLARAVDDASLTQSGVVAGTPLFMAPEQARCESIDHRADLFSLGAVLYAMCTGRSPFRAPTTMGVLRRVCDDTHRPVREANAEIPVELARVIDRLLAKEPDKRFQTSAEVAQILEQLLARKQQGWTGETEVTPPLGKLGLVDDVGPVKPRRHSRALQLAAYGLVLLSGVFVVAETTGTTKVLDTIATVLRIKTNEGTLMLEIFDPGMAVELDGQRIKIHGPGIQALTIDPGPHRVDKVDAKGNVSSEWISISRGDKLLVKVGSDPEQPLVALPRPTPVADIGYPVKLRPLPSVPILKTEVKRIRGHLAFVHDGRYLVGAGPGAEIAVYDSSSKTTRSHAAEGGDVKALEINEEIRCVLTASADGRVRFWDLFPLAEGDWTIKPHATPNLHGLNATALAMTKDSKLLALGGADGKLVLWDRKTNIRDDLAIHLGQAVTTLRLSPDDSMLAVGLSGGGVQLWNVLRDDPAHLTTKGLMEGVPSEVRFLEFSHDGRFLALASYTQIMLWDRQRGQLTSPPILSGGMNGICQLGFARSATNLLAVSIGSGRVVLWNADSNCETARFEASNLPITGLAFGTDGLTLATWGQGDESTRIWDVSVVSQPSSARAATLYDRLVPPALPGSRQAPGRVVDSSQIPVQQAASRLQEAKLARELAQAALERAQAELERVTAVSEAAKKNLERVEQLRARSAISQEVFDEAQAKHVASKSERGGALAGVKIAETKLRFAEEDQITAQQLLEEVSAPGPETGERREAILRRQAETALRRAQLERDVSAGELKVFKAALEGAIANHEYCKLASARIRRLREQKAVEQRTADEAESHVSVAEARVHLAQADVAQAEAKLKVAEQKLRDVKSNPSTHLEGDDASMRDRLEGELGRDPNAVLLLLGIKEEQERVRAAERAAAHPENDPAVVEHEKRLAELRDRYELLKKLKDELRPRSQPGSKPEQK